MMAEKPAQAFLSYAHTDDEFLDGGITWLRRELQRGVQAVTGEAFEIFQDADGIAFGEHWPSQIEEALIGARFLIPILTPSYFASPQCRAEAAAFLDLEKEAKRQDLILPIYLIEADVLENESLRERNDIAMRFYERQYADWRDVETNLRNSPRIKKRTFNLAKQIKAASARYPDYAPPIVPEQGPGIRFGLNKDGKLDRAPDEPTDVKDDDSRLCSLQDGLLDACNQFLGASGGGNAHRALIDNVSAYQNAITGKLTELQYTDVFRRGLTLQNQMLARNRDVLRLDPPPPLEDEQEAAINDLLTLHDLLILSTKEGQDLQAKADQARLTVTERSELCSPALSDAVQASDHATDRVKAILGEVNEPDEDGAVPNRHAFLALTTNRNFLTATGEAATGKDFSEIGVDATSEASHSAGRFLLKNEKLIGKLTATTQFGLSWLDHLITWLARRAPASTARPAPDAPTVIANDFWTPGRVFRDIDEPWCPEMVVIPAGKFLMGSPEDEEGRDENEGPQHLVTIEQPLALGRYPVTFEEYDFFCDEMKIEKPEDERWGRGRRPVINVTWDDATAYCAWLSERSEKRYRLPSEAEWEYACRAGSQSPYAFGETIDEKQANSGNMVGKTSEVGDYLANAYKLFDMHGNVWEWCADRYRHDHTDAPADGTYRVVRGGSWNYGARYVRSASRVRSEPGFRFDYLGFRCAGVQEES